jgi:hypothetical protein
MTGQLVHAALFGLLGPLLAGAHLASLKENVRLYTSGRSVSAAAAFHVLRLALAVVAWLIIARLGHAAGLLGAFGGFLIWRPLVTTWLGRARS